MNELSIILVSPPCYGSNIRLGENLGIRYICSYLNSKGFSCDILECDLENLSTELVAKKVIKYNVIGFSINYFEQYYSTKNILKELKSLNPPICPKIVLGGNYATFKYETLLKDEKLIDCIILGEGEHSFYQVVKNGFNNLHKIPNVVSFNSDFNSNSKENGYIPSDLDDFPFPLRDNNSFYLKNRHFSMVSSRGCYADCYFCSVSAFSNICNGKKKWRLRSVSNVIDEINYLYNTYNVEAISFLDSTFLGKDNISKKRALEIAKHLKKMNIKFSFECRAEAIDYNLFRELKEFGLCNVFIGIESGTKHGLKCFNKKTTINQNTKAIKIINDLSLSARYGFIIFFPEMEYEDFFINVKYLNANNILSSNALTNKLLIHYGTKYSEKNLDNIRFEDDGFCINYSFRDERINRLHKEIKFYCKPFKKYELILQKLIFERQVYRLTEQELQSIVRKIDKLNQELQNIFYYIATESYNKNITIESFDSEINNSYIKEKCSVLDIVLLK